MITRRNFIKATTFASVAAVLDPGMLKAASHKKNIGLQLYTLRNAINQDLAGTLASISAIGYTWLEAAGYSEGRFYGLSPHEFRKMVEDLGMKVISSHASITPEDRQMAVEAHLELGVSYLICPWVSIPEKPARDDYSRVAMLMNDLGETCSRQGLKFGYHNHAFEFVKIDDTTGFDLLLTLTDTKLVCFESDVYWMVYAGVDPLDYFGKYPGRFELWHVKDMEDNPDKAFAPVGTGTIDFKRIFRQEKQAGMAYFFVEQDKCQIDEIESVNISFKNLTRIAY